MPFATGPQLRYVGLGTYCTVGPTLYVGGQDVINIPPDTPTDLASVPRVFWAVMPPSGAYERAAVLHDYLCVDLAHARRDNRPPLIASRDVDGLFRRVAKECGVGVATRWILWTGVRWGALANPSRRGGWLRDSPLTLGVTALVLAVVGGLVYGVDRLVHCIF